MYEELSVIGHQRSTSLFHNQNDNILIGVCNNEYPSTLKLMA